MDDQELLLEYARNRTSSAFGTVVQRHVDLVYSAALRRVGGDHHRAADVTQQVFTDLARKAAKVAAHPVLSGWLHQSTRWAAASLRRAEQRRAGYEQVAAQEIARAGAEAAPNWEELRPVLDAALDELKPNDRDAVLLRYFSSQAYGDIGERLGVTENAARMRVERALDNLAEALRRRGITSVASALAVVLSQQGVAAAPTGLGATVTAGAVAQSSSAAAASGHLLLAKVQLAMVVGLAAVLATALGRAWHVRNVQRQELSSAQAGHSAVEQQLASARAHLAASRTRLATTASAAYPESVLSSVQQERNRLDLIVRRGELDFQYAPLFRVLMLDPAMMDRFKTLLVQRNQAGFDGLQAAKTEGLELSWSEELAVRTAAARDVDAALVALLGSAKMGAFLDYEATLPIRQRLPLPMVEDPARADAVEHAVQVLQQIAPTYIDDCMASGMTAPFPDEFLQQVKPFLTPREQRQLAAMNETNVVNQRLIAIARAAAYAGKLKLSRNSAKYYASPTPRQPGSGS